jgi:hypothetical protein
MSDRELKEVKLSGGLIAKIVTFFTRGEMNEITRMSWGDAKAENQDNGEIKIVNIPINQGQLEQDAIVLQGTKFINDESVTQETINNLNIEDFNVLLTALKEVKQGKKKTN